MGRYVKELGEAGETGDGSLSPFSESSEKGDKEPSPVTVHGLTALICKNPRRVGNHVKLHLPMLPYEQKESLLIILFCF